MAGGVFEWPGDWAGGYPTGGIHLNPTGPKEGVLRVFGGGGSWILDPFNARAAYRNDYHPDYADIYDGLRGVLRPQGS